jgi:hypothetical protein
MNSVVPPSDRFDLNAAFEAMNGISLDDFVFLSFGLFAATTAQPGHTFGVQQFVNSEFDIPEAMARIYYDLSSRTYSEFRMAASHPDVAVPGYELYSVNPLRRYPLVRFPQGDHIVPIPRFLLERATFGVYYDFFRGLPDRKQRSRFGNFWGSAFSAYVGELMRRTETLSEPVSPDTDKGSATGKICDWIVEDDECVLLIECKTYAFGTRTKITGAEDSVRADVRRDEAGGGLAKAVLQLLETRDRLRPTRPRKQFAHLVVTLDHVYYANTPWLQSIIWQEASSLACSPLPYDFNLQATDIGGFEVLCRLAMQSGRSIGRILLEKMATEATFELEIGDYCWKQAPEGLTRHPMHAELDMNAIAEEYRRVKAS